MIPPNFCTNSCCLCKKIWLGWRCDRNNPPCEGRTKPSEDRLNVYPCWERGAKCPWRRSAQGDVPLALKSISLCSMRMLHPPTPFIRGITRNPTNKHKKKADTVSQPVRLSCKKLRFHNPSSCRIFKSLTFLFNFPFHTIIYVKVNIQMKKNILSLKIISI